MKILIAAATAASALALAAPASAEIYGNLGYSVADLGLANVDAITARAGWKFTDMFAVEGEVSAGVDGDRVGGTKVELDRQFAIYGVASAPVTEAVSAHLRVGYGDQTVSLTPGGDESDQSWNYGVGAQWMFAGNNGLRLDYTRIDFDAEAALRDSDVWTLSFAHRF
jgi:outer membrane immunogenic protein